MDLGDIITITMTVLLVLVGIVTWGKSKGKDDNSSGTIVVIKEGSKIIYSLELDDDPENLQHKDKVVFRVKTEAVEDPAQDKHGV
jgi:uncharacterized protein YndB with AHSA1/START domain